MSKNPMFTVGADKDVLYSTYLNAFENGTNPLFREKTEHDCNCCKSFIRTIGAVVSYVDGALVSIWDCMAEDEYTVVSKTMSAYIKSLSVKGIYLSSFASVGKKVTSELNAFGNTTGLVWEHFHFELPKKFVVPSDHIGERRNRINTNKSVLERGLNELTQDALSTVTDLIANNQLLRGAEDKTTLGMISNLYGTYSNLSTENTKQAFLWETSLELNEASKFRNTLLGILLTNLSEGVMSVSKAVAGYEDKKNGAKYKRPTKLATQKDKDRANKRIADLGIAESLKRRYATINDITINNVLFADKSAQAFMKDASPLDCIDAFLAPQVFKETGDTQEVSIEYFLNQIVPKTNTVEAYVEGRHEANFMSLIAPAVASAPPILKWGNNFSWSYNGEVTDSIAQMVKKAGGSITGDFRASALWYNYDDLDIQLVLPCGDVVSYSSPISRHKCNATLDVDENATSTTRTPVENITISDIKKAPTGVYEVRINNFKLRERCDVGFEVELQILGCKLNFKYDKMVRQNETIVVVKFYLNPDGSFAIIEAIPQNEKSVNIWGINTCNYHKVSTIMKSPNFWDGASIGNEHTFFMLEDCRNPEQSRGLYNEFLMNELYKDRLVFEMLGSVLKTEKSEQQLSGLGFSVTQKNHVILRVRGEINKVFKVLF